MTNFKYNAVNPVTPIFEHDCDSCDFLGTFEGEDLYFCGTSPVPTVISRFGKHDNYSSGLTSATEDGNPYLYEAKLRAIKLRLLPEYMRHQQYLSTEDMEERAERMKKDYPTPLVPESDQEEEKKPFIPVISKEAMLRFMSPDNLYKVMMEEGEDAERAERELWTRTCKIK